MVWYGCQLRKYEPLICILLGFFSGHSVIRLFYAVILIAILQKNVIANNSGTTNFQLGISLALGVHLYYFVKVNHQASIILLPTYYLYCYIAEVSMTGQRYISQTDGGQPVLER